MVKQDVSNLVPKQKAFFRLHNDTLLYYLNGITEFPEQITLPEADILRVPDSQTQFCISINCGDAKKNYVLEANDANEADAWLHNLKLAQEWKIKSSSIDKIMKAHPKIPCKSDCDSNTYDQSTVPSLRTSILSHGSIPSCTSPPSCTSRLSRTSSSSPPYSRVNGSLLFKVITGPRVSRLKHRKNDMNLVSLTLGESSYDMNGKKNGCSTWANTHGLVEFTGCGKRAKRMDTLTFVEELSNVKENKEINTSLLIQESEQVLDQNKNNKKIDTLEFVEESNNVKNNEKIDTLLFSKESTEENNELIDTSSSIKEPIIDKKNPNPSLIMQHIDELYCMSKKIENMIEILQHSGKDTSQIKKKIQNIQEQIFKNVCTKDDIQTGKTTSKMLVGNELMNHGSYNNLWRKTIGEKDEPILARKSRVTLVTRLSSTISSASFSSPKYYYYYYYYYHYYYAHLKFFLTMDFTFADV